MTLFKDKISEKKVKYIFVVLCVGLALIAAIVQPSNTGPDENMKMQICKYVADYGKLPHGGDDLVRDPSWGISYGFTPITPYIVAGLFIKVTSIFTQDIHAFYIAARLVSVICYGIFVFLNIKIGEKLFEKGYYKWLFIGLTSLIPQMVFIGSYVNNDCFAMMTISMIIHTWLVGMNDNWRTKTCIKLGVALGLCALSYYNAYGYILTSIVLFIGLNIANKIKIKEILKKGAIVTVITAAVAGWWFIRSAIIYDGDFLGLQTTDKYSNEYAIDELKASNRMNPQQEGISLKEMLFGRSWITLTVRSFVGIFGGMSVPIKYHVCVIAVLIILTGCVAYLAMLFRKRKR